MHRFGSAIRSLLLTAGVLLLTPAALAQHGGGPPGGGGGHPGGGMPGGSLSGTMPGGFGADRSNFPRSSGNPPPGNAPDAGSTTSTMRGGLQLGPPGRWWDDKHFAKELKLRNDQQRRMDGIFEASRTGLLRSYQNLEQEQSRMEALTHARVLDETTLFAQIDRVAQARAELEKANTHLLLQIRSEMDAEQITRLEQHR